MIAGVAEGSGLSLPHLDLLLSKLFHDLISPVSAARNGLELMREFGSDDEVGTDALELVGLSVAQAADRLTFFRMAYGGAGSGGGLDVRQAHELARAYLEARRVEGPVGDWPVAAPRDGVLKVLLGAVAVIADALPKSGEVMVRVTADGCRLSARGEGAGLSAAAIGQLALVEEPDAGTILARCLALNAARFGVRIEPEGVDGLDLSW